MLLTISTTHQPATDLGFLLHKHPDRAQSFEVSAGTAHVFYPEASNDRCIAVLMLDVDSMALARGSGRTTKNDFTLGQYVNDRPYAASSLLASALKRVFSTAFAGTLKSNQALADSAIPLEISIPALPCAAGPDFAKALFEPLGWTVTATPVALDPTFPDWGDSRFVSLTATGTMRLADALSQFYVLLPVLDNAKHYWVAEDEVDKLVRHGEGWLADHPMRDAIARRYLAHSRPLSNQAIERLIEQGGDDAEAVPIEEQPEAEVAAPRLRLAEVRRDAIVAELAALGASKVADVGCGDGALLAPLLKDGRFTKVVGTDVSAVALQRASRRLHIDRMTESQAARIEIFQSSATYRDRRLEGFDAIVLMEVIEHLDIERLPALVTTVFAQAKPTHVLASTPNREHNVRFDSLLDNGFRHPDHRWEMTRGEFAAWADETAAAHGYTVRIVGIGEDDPEVGAPTQMAIFTRATPTAEPGEAS